MLAKFTSQLCLDLLEVQRLHLSTGSAVDLRLVPDDLGTQWFWESTNGLTKVTLEKLDD
jgi:hypothetical protein